MATTARRRGSRPATKPRPAPKTPAREAPVETTVITPSTPEPGFAARVAPPPPERPRPTTRRAIFLDVENTSRPQELAQILEHLAVDRRDSATDLVAVANWKVVSHDSARMLARMGAHLVHSAPSTGVRDWSDLRIAVAAGIWLAAARSGDTIEIVSDDRAFDAVGDVAASLGIAFRRLSYRRLGRGEGPEPAAPKPRRPQRRGGRGRSRRPGPSRGFGREPKPGGHPAPPRPALAAPAPPSPAPDSSELHTAPHDEVVSVVRDLVEASPSGTTTLDALANALKGRGFRRTPGSPRLVTRLRRIREIVVGPNGAITLAGDHPEAPSAAEPPYEPMADVPPPGQSAPLQEGNRVGRRRRRRRRRGGHRRSAPTAPPA